MSRRTTSAALLAALITFGAAMPWLGLAPRAAATSCSEWTSETQPPPTIRVFRHVSGAVETVDFRAYTKNVLSREWIGSWTVESLRSGALAVKHYAWYQVLHWRGGVNAAGECFDLRDDTWDQVYDPSKPTWSTAAAAVDATWETRVLKHGLIFPTYYNAGAVNEACGANANGWKAFQWGTQACGLAGRTAAQIMTIYYYPGVTVTDAPAPTPTPVPTATPSPSPIPTPSPTPSPSSSSTVSPAPTPPATPSPSPTPAATPTPPPTPTPAPLPTPPPAQQLPGGGQATVAGAVAPPPPPPAAPAPTVVHAVVPAPSASTFRGQLAAWERSPAAMRRVLEHSDGPGSEGSWPAPAGEIVGSEALPAGADARLAAFRPLWRAAVRQLTVAIARQLTAGRSVAGRPGLARR